MQSGTLDVQSDHASDMRTWSVGEADVRALLQAKSPPQQPLFTTHTAGKAGGIGASVIPVTAST